MCSEEVGAKTENLRELRRMDEWKERGRGAVLNITQYEREGNQEEQIQQEEGDGYKEVLKKG